MRQGIYYPRYNSAPEILDSLGIFGVLSDVKRRFHRSLWLASPQSPQRIQLSPRKACNLPTRMGCLRSLLRRQRRLLQKLQGFDNRVPDSVPFSLWRIMGGCWRFFLLATSSRFLFPTFKIDSTKSPLIFIYLGQSISYCISEITTKSDL